MTDPVGRQNTQDIRLVYERNNRIIKWSLVSIAVLLGVLLLVFQLGLDVLDVGLVATLVGVVAGVLPLPLLLALIVWIDRYEKEPFWMVVTAFLWGALVAGAIALIVNTFNFMLFSGVFGEQAGGLFVIVVAGPVVEEGSKGLALFILYWWKKDEFDGVIDGILYGAMVGLGFATTENMSYYAEFFAQGGIALTLFGFVLRSVFGGLGHSLYTAITGIGLGLARQSNSAYVKVGAPLVALLAAMFLHSMWNFFASVLDPVLTAQVASHGILAVLLAMSLPSFLILTLPEMLIVLAFVFFGLRREGRIVRQYLTPEVQSGLMTQLEYDALSNVRGRLGSSFRALSRGGLGSWYAYSRFAQAATELAFHRDRVARGITSVDAASREAAYVQLLHNLKGRPQAG